MSSDGEPAPPAAPAANSRTGRRWLVALAALAAVLAGTVALAPTLVSMGLFRGAILGAVGSRVNGTVAIADLSVGWSGPLAVRGLVIDDAANGNRVAADVSVEQGLWALLTRGAERLDVRVGGSLRTRLEADGTLAIGKLLRDAPPGDRPHAPLAAPAVRPAKPGLPAGIRHLSVTVDDLDLEVLQPGGATHLAVRDLAGAASVDAGQGATVRLSAKTELKGAAGSIDLKATLPGLFATDGSLALDSASADAELRAAEVALESGGLALRVSSATASVRSARLTGRIDVTLAVDAALDGAPPAAIAAELAIDRLLTPEGGAIADLSAIHGSVSVAGLPTGPFERFAEGTGVVLARDVGPTVSLEARFADAAGGELSVALRSERLSLTARGSVDPATRAANFPAIDADASLAPELLAALAEVTVTAPARLSLRARSVSIPAPGADGTVPVGAASFDADATLELAGLRVPGPGGGIPLDLSALRLTARAAPVSAGIELAAAADAPTLKADLRATVAADGTVRVLRGSRIDATPVPGDLIRALGVRADGDLALAVAVHRLELPAPVGAAGIARAAADLEASVRPAAERPVGVVIGGGDAARTVRVSELRLSLASGAIGSDVRAALAVRSDLASVDADLSAQGLGDLSEAAIDRAELALALKASGIPAKRLVAEAPALKDLLPRLGGASWDAELSYRGSMVRGDGTATVRSGTTEVLAKAALREAELSAEATAALDVTPALVAAAAPGMTVRLAGPARATAVIEPVSMRRPARWSFEAPAALAATVRIPALEAAKVPGTKGNPVLSDLSLQARATFGGRVSAKGALSATLAARRRGAAPVAIAPFRGAFEWSAAEGAVPARWSADATLAPIAADGVAALVELDEAARREIGAGARIAAKASSAGGGIAFELSSTLERMKVQAAGSLAGDELAIARSSVDLALTAQQATELANGPGPKAGPGGKAAPPAWKEVGPVAVRAEVDSLRMRLGGGVRSAVARVEAKPFPMVAADGQRISVDGVKASVDMPAPDRAATVRAATVLVGSGGRAPVSLDAQVAGWSAPDGSFSAGSLRVDGALKAERASTAVLGVLLGMGAELGEALGPELTVEATAASTAPGAVAIAARAASRYATLDAPRVDLRAGSLAVSPATPVTLDFLPSPPLRRRYLAPINPVFRDIRLADDRKPIRLAVPMASYPLDGDLSRLDADLRLTVGDVVLERSRANELLDLLKQFQPDAKRVVAPVEGNIGPLAVTVRKGQLAYKDFAVGIGRQGSSWTTLLIFDGDVDLAQKPPFVRRIGANYPLSSVAREVVALLPNDDGGGFIGDALSTISLNVGDAAQLRVSLSGPLGEVNGEPAELKRRIRLVFDERQLGKGLEDVGRKAAEAIGDWLKGR